MQRLLKRILLFPFQSAIIGIFVAMSTLKTVIVAVSKDQWEECFSVSKRGENIYKRKDGRWEGRYIKERSADGKARYAYVYGKSYADAKQKLLDRRIAQAQNIDCSPSHTKYGDILRNWIAMSRVHIKESTYSRYIHLANAHILPYLRELPTGKLTTQTVEKHISFLLNKGRVDKKGGLAPKTVSDILTLI